MKKRILKLFGILLCVALSIAVISGFSVTTSAAAPSKYDVVSLSTNFDHCEYLIGEEVEIPLVLSSCGEGNQTYELIITDERGKTVEKFSDNFPNKIGVSTYQYVWDTTGLKPGYYSISVNNMLYPSKVSYSSTEICLNDYAYTNYFDIYTNNTIYNEYSPLSSPNSVYDSYFGETDDDGNSDFHFSVSTIKKGYDAWMQTNWGDGNSDYPETVDGYQWFALNFWINNFNDNDLVLSDVISEASFCDSTGNPIEILEIADLGSGYISNFDYTFAPNDSDGVYITMLIPESIDFPYLKLSIGNNVTYYNLNPEYEKAYYADIDEEDGSLRAYCGDVFQSGYYGFIPYEGVLYYFVGGIVDETFSEIVWYSGVNYLVKNGVLDVDFTGVYEDTYFTKSIEDQNFTGLVDIEGELVYYCYGSKNESNTDITYYNGIWYYINNGLIETTMSGIYYSHYYPTVIIKNGQVDTSFTGLAYSDWDSEWCYFSNGVQDYDYVGIVHHEGTYYYVQDGRICYDETISCYGGTWYYVNDGQIDWSANTTCWYGEDDGAVYCIRNGMVDFTYSGPFFYEEFDYGWEEWYTECRYVENGVVNEDFDGLVYHEGTYYYFEDGYLYNWDETLCYLDGTWYYINDGKIDFSANTLCWYGDEEESNYCVRNGMVDFSYTGPFTYYEYDEYWEEWYTECRYVQNGVVNYDFTGLVYHEGTYYYFEDGYPCGEETLYYLDGVWYYVNENGQIDFSANTLCWYGDYRNHSLYYIKNGVVDFSYTGLYYQDYDIYDEWDGEWIYVENGVVNYDYTGLVYHGGIYYYVEDGFLSYYETITNFGGTWYYVNDGQIDWYSNTLVNYNGIWYYVHNGVVDWTSVTLVPYGNAWYSVANGCVNWNYNGLQEFNGGWYYIENGSINWNARTLANLNGTWYFVNYGEIDWYSETLCYFGGTLYYVRNGVVDWNADTLVYYDSTWYYVRNGAVDFTANKQVVFGGNTYNVVNGVVVF